MASEDDSEQTPTEGVRIIGAQEAAEAAGRPDVVRRRSRSEKKFGDRPDAPETDSDLPKIRISTSEPPADAGSGADQGPLVHPQLDARTSIDDDEEVIVVSGYDRPRVGHARIVEADDADEPAEADAVVDDVDDSSTGATADPEVTSGGDDRSVFDESPLFRSDEEMDSTDGWDIEDPLIDDGLDGGDDSDGDGSFVLPHWTEPATGQVPKVITGVEEVVDPSAAESPRWHSEGERAVMTDFTDLADDGPRLGALGGSLDDFDDYDPDFIDDDGFGDAGRDFFDGDDDFLDDDDDGFGDFEPTRPRRSRDSDDSGPPSGDRDLGAAVGVGVALVAVGLLCFRLGGLATTVLVAVIIVIAAMEAISALNRKGFATPAILALPAVVGLLFGTYFVGASAYPVVLGLTVMTTLLWYLWVSPGSRAALKIGGTFLVVMWVGFLGSFATLMLGIGRELESIDTTITSNPGIGVLIAVVLVTVSHDVGAYFTGRYMGRTPLSVASPNKTYEGLAGGVIAAIVVTVVVVGFIGIGPVGDSIPKTIVFSVLCAAVAPLGDLCQSAIKRDLKVKDMGSILPGHGGVLDRFDAMLFVLPTAYFVTLLLDVWTVTA